MNCVYRRDENIPLTAVELAYEANRITRSKPFTPNDFIGSNSRIQGTGHCDCCGNGRFELYSVLHPFVCEGKKRYMKCKICGGISHL